MVRGGDPAEYGGFLGTLASIAVPLAIDLVSKLQKNASKPPALTPRSLLLPPREVTCMHMRPPPFSYSWDNYLEKKTKVQRRSSFQY